MGTSDFNIEELLEQGHRCPACGRQEFGSLDLNVAQCSSYREVTPGNWDWHVMPTGGHGAYPDSATLELCLGSIRVWCISCGFILWSIVPELEEAIQELRSASRLKPADAEGRT